MEETDDICFVCDKTIPTDKWKYQLLVTATKKRNLPVADLIKQLVGEEYAVLVGERDAVCSKCMNMLNIMDSLTAELADVTNLLTRLLHTKYNLTSDNNNFQVDYDESIQDEFEPLYKCQFCNFRTKYEKEFNSHVRTHSGSKYGPKSFLDELTPTLEPLQSFKSNNLNLKSKDKPTKAVENKKKTPPGKKKGKRKRTPVKEKKKKVLFQCSVCEQLFTSEKEITNHAKKEHGKDKIQVSSEDEYADVQTLESDEDTLVQDNKENVGDKDLSSPSKQNLDFLADWQDDDDIEEFVSPSKKAKPSKAKERKLSNDSKDDEYSDDKDSVSKPTCLFCHAVFFSLEAVQDHIRLNHKDRSFKNTKTKNKSGETNSFKEDSSSGSSKKLFRCNLCGIKKVSLKFIKEHVKEHQKKMALQCKYCGISCRNVMALKVHGSKCNKAASISKKCSMCSMKFFDSKELKNHVSKVHKSKTPLVRLKGYDADGDDWTESSSKKKTAKSPKKAAPKKKSKKVSQDKNKMCTLCNIYFEKQSRLRVHMNRHKANSCLDMGICVFCNKVFFDKHQLYIHNSAKHGSLSDENKDTKCISCDKVYSHAKDMKVHFMSVHFKEEEIESLMKQVTEHKSKAAGTEKNDVYNKVFKELQDLTGEGNENEDSLLIKFECPLCEYEFKNKSEIDAHIPSHSQNYCNICQSLLSTQIALKHIENHSIESKNLVCSQCPEIFHDDVHLRFHTQSKHPVERSQHNCSMCSASYPTKRSLLHHKSNVHGKDEKSFKCAMCSSTYSTRKAMLQHQISTHGKVAEKSFTCSQCNVQFLFEKKYQLHVEYGHRTSLNCKFCDKAFDNINIIAAHEKNHLQQAKNIYKCNICGKVLKSQQALKSHKSNHTSSSLKCEVCNQSFKSFHSLREHSASHSETQEKKYFCDICNKGFYFYDSHSRHRRVHLDPLLFQCKICRERFETHQELVDHKVTCSVLTKCTECGADFPSLADLKKHDCPCLNDIEMLS